MQNVLEQGPDFWCWFDKTQFSYHCVHPIHAKMFSIQMLLHFSQIALRVCTLVLYIIYSRAMNGQIQLKKQSLSETHSPPLNSRFSKTKTKIHKKSCQPDHTIPPSLSLLPPSIPPTVPPSPPFLPHHLRYPFIRWFVH